jgi:hypothetical protein
MQKVNGGGSKGKYLAHYGIVRDRYTVNTK